MFGLDKYTDTVLLAYAVSIIMLLGLVWITFVQSKKSKNKLEQEEAKHNAKD